MARLKRYILFVLLIAIILIRFIPSMYYTGGMYEDIGKGMYAFNGQTIPFKWVVFIQCELITWFLEAVMVAYVLQQKRFMGVLYATMIVWAISRGFDILQFYIPSLVVVNQISITIKILFNIGILFVAIVRFDTEEDLQG